MSVIDQNKGQKISWADIYPYSANYLTISFDRKLQAYSFMIQVSFNLLEAGVIFFLQCVYISVVNSKY